MSDLTPHVRFARDEWARLRAATPLTLSEDDLERLRGINEHVSLDEVVDIYLPLSRLLNLYVAASQSLHRVTDTFLGSPAAKVPVRHRASPGASRSGKSTTARILQALLARWPDHPQVDLVTTDGFLFPNAGARGARAHGAQGLPRELRRAPRSSSFLTDVKSGRDEVAAPVYSHLTYDIVPDEWQVVRQPDIVILEGLNVLQTGDGQSRRPPPLFVSDFFDFSIYVDADEDDIEQWYVERFLTLRETVFPDDRVVLPPLRRALATTTRRRGPADLERRSTAVNLHENILPTRDRARLILEKQADHTVGAVRLRRL